MSTTKLLSNQEFYFTMCPTLKILFIHRHEKDVEKEVYKQLYAKNIVSPLLEKVLLICTNNINNTQDTLSHATLTIEF